MQWYLHAGAMTHILVAEVAARFMIPPTTRRRDRIVWYATHGVCNGAVAAMTYNDMRQLVVYGPIAEACLPNTYPNEFPMALTLYLHLWHALWYPLTFDDVMHHAVFITLLALPGYWWDWGRCGNALVWFVNGAPGACLYLLTVAQALGTLTRIDEAQVACLITSFLRMPGALLSLYQLFLAHRADVLAPPKLAVALQLILVPTNAVYYALQTCVRLRRKRQK